MSKTVCSIAYTSGDATTCGNGAAGAVKGTLTLVEGVCVKLAAAVSYKMTACTTTKASITSYATADCTSTATVTTSDITVLSSCTAMAGVWGPT